MFSPKSLLDRLPGNVGAAAHDSMWTLVFELMTLVTATGSFVLLGRELGSREYGEYVGLFALLAPVGAIGAAAGLSTLQAHFQQGRAVHEVVGTFLTATTVGGIVALGLVSALADRILDTVTLTTIVVFGAGELLVRPAISVIAAGIRAREGVPAMVRVQMAVLSLRFVSLVALALTDSLTVHRLGVTWLATTTLVLAGVWVITLPRLELPVRLRAVSMNDFRTLGGLGAPIYVASFKTSGDKAVLVGANLDEEAGLYGAAFRVASLALAPLRAMDRAVFHKFLVADEGEAGLHVRRAKLFTRWSLVVVIPAALLLLLVAPGIKILVGDEFAGSVEMARWLALWLPLHAIAAPPVNGLLGLGRLGLRVVALTISAAISMALYLTLIPSMGWEGAVIGTVVGEASQAILVWSALFWAQKRRDLELASKPVLAGT